MQHGREDGASNRDETPTNSTEEDARRREAILRDTTEEGTL